MKIRFALAAVTMIAAAPAQAADSGYYAGIGGGLSVPATSNPILTRPSNAPHLTHTTFSAGWGGAGVIGYKSAAGLRTEMEIGYRQSALQHMDAGVATGHQSVLSVMGNLMFDVGSGSALQPYIGGGVGAAWARWHNVQPTASATLPGVLPLFNDASPAAFQYQGIAGLTYPVGPTTDMFAEYHYVGTTNAKFESAALPGATFTEHRISSHNLMVGVRFTFATLP